MPLWVCYLKNNFQKIHLTCANSKETTVQPRGRILITPITDNCFKSKRKLGNAMHRLLVEQHTDTFRK